MEYYEINLENSLADLISMILGGYILLQIYSLILRMFLKLWLSKGKSLCNDFIHFFVQLPIHFSYFQHFPSALFS